ncbi:MAG: phosphoribosylanthranilate isomerase [Muribaculaceae bacterium]|nr:phosphoribosylanthranilate isomerase [Muribaculaceae bacterium]
MNRFEQPRHADMIIKICGMRYPENIKEITPLTPMMMGFIFYPESPRDATGIDESVVKNLPSYIRPVAVTVNRTFDEIIDLCDRYGFKIVQLHGDETPGLCQRLKDAGLIVFKAVSVGDSVDKSLLESYQKSVDLFLFDTKSDKRGGSGQKFSWDLLENYDLDVPYLLSGGISPDDAEAVVGAMRPGMAGIDINSRFEDSPGHKDLGKLIKFIVKLRSYNEYEPTKVPFWEKEI